jgi:hypothetical protein
MCVDPAKEYTVLLSTEMTKECNDTEDVDEARSLHPQRSVKHQSHTTNSPCIITHARSGVLYPVSRGSYDLESQYGVLIWVLTCTW